MPNAHVGIDVDIRDIRAKNDAVVLCTGATWPRDLKIKGRDAAGIHFAMEYLQVSLYSALLTGFSRRCGVDRDIITLRLAEHRITSGF